MHTYIFSIFQTSLKLSCCLLPLFMIKKDQPVPVKTNCDQDHMIWFKPATTIIFPRVEEVTLPLDSEPKDQCLDTWTTVS